MNRESVAQWLEKYIEAWRSYDTQIVGELFSKDATYRFQPWGDPVTGRDAIIANWLEERDDPDSWDAEYEPYAVDGDNVVTVGWTHYFTEDRKTIDRTYYNVWLMKFNKSGECTEFVEVYMERPTK